MRVKKHVNLVTKQIYIYRTLVEINQTSDRVHRCVSTFSTPQMCINKKSLKFTIMINFNMWIFSHWSTKSWTLYWYIDSPKYSKISRVFRYSRSKKGQITARNSWETNVISRTIRTSRPTLPRCKYPRN
jgi:hypothetical protein